MSIELPHAVGEWQARGRFVRLSGMEVFVLDTGPSDAAQTAVILHGFPSSSYDWRQSLPVLAEGRRIVLLDFPGFGLSEKPALYSYSLLEQTDIVEQLLRLLGVSEAHVAAHDMGTSVACELMARRERGLLSFKVPSLLLMNGSVHLELAHLTPSQRLLHSPLGKLFARFSSIRIFKAQLRRILGRPVAEEELDAMWAEIEHRDGRNRLPQLIYYLDERERFRHRWIGALTRLDLPVLVLWGMLDPVAVFAIAEQLVKETPGARLERLDDLGHYPQLEDPERVAAAIARHWAAAQGSSSGA